MTKKLTADNVAFIYEGLHLDIEDKKSEKKLLRKLAKFDNPEFIAQYVYTYELGQWDTLLHACARFGYAKLADNLLKYGTYVNSPNCFLETPAYIAIAFGHSEVLDVLIKYKADLDIAQCAGQTPAMVAGLMNDAPTIHLLAKHNVDFNAADRRGRAAAHKARTDAIKALAEYGADLNIPNKNGDTPLHFVARASPSRYRSIRITELKVMLEHGAIVKANKEGNTVLHRIVKRRNLEALETHLCV